MNDVNVKFLGSGDIFGSGGRFQTCIHIQAESTQFLMDCGASSMIAMQHFGVDPAEIDLILLSHLHGDHFGGLPFFILEAQLNSKRDRPLIVAGPPGVEARVRQAMEILFPGSSQMSLRFNLDFIELTPEMDTFIGGLTISSYVVVHESGAPSYALRVSCNDKVIAYSGDTEWTDNLIEAAQGANLFICEAYFYDKPIKNHLDYHTLMAHRPQLDCDQLVLTHMNMDLLEHFHKIDVEWAEDGMQIAL